MTTRCNLEESDYRAFRRHVLFRYRKIHWLYGGLLVLILLLTWFGGRPEETTTEKVFTLLGVAVVFGGAGLVFYIILRIIGRFTGARFGKIETRLGGIRHIDETPQHFFVITTSGMGHVIPKRALESPDALRVLQSKVTKQAP